MSSPRLLQDCDFLSYTNTKVGLTIDYPKEWIKYEERSNNLVSFYNTDPYSKDQDANNGSCISISVQDLTNTTINSTTNTEITLEEFTAITLQQMKSLHNITELRLFDYKLADIDGKKLEWTQKFDNNVTPRKFLQCWITKERTAYVFSYSSKVTNYATHLPLAEYCAKSFCLIKPISGGSLKSDIASLFNNPDYADVVFVVEEIEIPGVSYNVFLALIGYLYNDEVNVSSDVAFPLLMLADSYLLERLKTKCEYILCDSATVENVCSLLITAKQYGAEHLRKHCLKYIRRHKDHIKSTNGFADLSNKPDVLLDLLLEFMNPE